MKVVIPGGSGQVGTMLARSFHADGHEVVVLSRNGAPGPWRCVAWSATTLGDWTRELEGADAVINLAGKNVNCRYGRANRREILDSRVLSARTVGRAIAACSRPPRAWLQASSATVYGHRFDAANDEASGRIGADAPGAPAAWRFSVEVVTAWERELARAELPATRKVALRSAITLSPDRGGIFDTLLRLVRCGLGGTAGDGRQYVSWIHERDFVGAVRFLLDRELQGTVNVAAPAPLPNAEFMRVLRRAWGARLGLPAPRGMLELGAFFLRTETELVLKSRRVVPGRLLEHGFEFRYPTWPDAAAELCARWRQNHNARREERPS